MKRILQAPWRMAYLAKGKPQEKGPTPDPCVFCGVAELAADEARRRLILARAKTCYLTLNAYPYNPGHIMVLPYAHLGSLTDVADDSYNELFQLVRQGLKRLPEALRCEGINMGLNQGSCAGSSITDHVHVQLVPRWPGDTNFMPVIGETRVNPQALDDAFRLLRPHFQDLDV